MSREFNFSTETTNNYAERTICCFVLDTSGSMKGTRINKLNEGLQAFYNDIINDNEGLREKLEIAIIEFNSSVNTLQIPALVDDFNMPILETKGSTKIVDGVREAKQLITARKAWYKSSGIPFLRPWIVLITDGAPDHDQDVDALSLEIEKDTKDKKYFLQSLGVGEYNQAVLEKLSGFENKDKENWTRVKPFKLGDKTFKEFFEWLSASFSTFTQSGGGTLDQNNGGSFDGGMTTF